MVVKVFGIKGCQECNDTLDYLDANEILYEYYDVDASVENYNLMNKFRPESHTTAPVIVINGEFIGGYRELQCRKTT